MKKGVRLATSSATRSSKQLPPDRRVPVLEAAVSTHPWLVVDDEPEYGWDVDLPAPFAGREALSALERIGTTLRETLRNREIAERAGLVHGAVQKVLGGHAGAGADPS